MTRRKVIRAEPGQGTVDVADARGQERRARKSFKKLAEEEQPGGFITDLLSPKALVSRRSFVQGSSIAALAAGLQGCVRRPENEILPYSKAPEHLVPGVASHFATVTARGRDALGVVVTSHEGRPTKVEGNAYHRRSLGGTDVRARPTCGTCTIRIARNRPRSATATRWRRDSEAARQAARRSDQEARVGRGSGLRFSRRISNSPTFRTHARQGARAIPQGTLPHLQRRRRRQRARGATIAFGEPRHPGLHYRAAKAVVSLGSDFLGRRAGCRGDGRRVRLDTRAVDSPLAR